MVLHFLNDGIRTTFVTLLPFIAKDLKITLSSVGFLGSAQPLVASLVALPAGFLGARLGGFRFLILLLIVYSFGALSAALSPNLPFIIFAFFLGALGFGMFHTVGFSLVAKISDTGVGKNMGEFTSVGDIGRVAIPPAAVFLVSISGWRISMVAVALTGFACFLILQLYQARSKEPHLADTHLEKETQKEFISHMIKLLKTKQLVLTLFTAIIDSLASSSVYLFLTFLLLAKGLHITEYGIVTGVFFVGSMLGKYILGIIVDKIGDLKVFIFSEVLMATVLILLTFPINFIFILISVLLLGTFTRGTTPVINSLFSKTSHKMHYNKIYALSEMFIGIAAVISIILMGIIAEKTSVFIVFYLSATFALLATLPALLLSKQNPN